MIITIAFISGFLVALVAGALVYAGVNVKDFGDEADYHDDAWIRAPD